MSAAACTRPVSAPTLASIPWASHKALPHLMQRVATNGPNDLETWRKLTGRASVILKSFQPKDMSLCLNAMSRSGHRDEDFLHNAVNKVLVKRMLKKMDSAQDFSNIIHGLSSLLRKSEFNENLSGLLKEKTIDLAPRMDSQQIAMVSNAMAKIGMDDDEAFAALLARACQPEVSGDLSGQGLAMVLNSVARVASSSVPPCSLTPLLEVVKQRCASFDLKSVCVIFNALARLPPSSSEGSPLNQVSFLLCEQALMKLEGFYSGQQVSMLLNGMAKLNVQHADLLECLIEKVGKASSRSFDLPALCICANAFAKLDVRREGVWVKMSKLLQEKLKGKVEIISGKQLGMISHAWGKVYAPDSSLFNFLKPEITRKVEEKELKGREIALVLFGLAKLFKNDASFAPVFMRIAEELARQVEECEVLPLDLLMASNSLSRVGVRREELGSWVRQYAETNGIKHLTPASVEMYLKGGGEGGEGEERRR